MKYNIPKKMQLGGQTITTKIMKDIEVEGAIGVYKSLQNEIRVQTHANGMAIAKTKVEQTYWHEYAHAVTDACRREDLCVNEEFIDLLGEFLFQSVGQNTWS